MLEDAIRRNPSGAKAHYYLGNLYYDKRRYEDAIRAWRRSVELDDSFSIPLRNLGIAEFNVLHDRAAADRMYERAFQANRNDARLLYEWDQLKKRAALASPEERLAIDGSTSESSSRRRDDLTVEYVTLLNQCGQNQAALELLSHRRFSPWEGGEGLVSAQYVQAHKALGRAARWQAGDFRIAFDHFQAARRYPENLGEGKHLLTLERDLDYYSGLAAQKLGEISIGPSLLDCRGCAPAFAGNSFIFSGSRTDRAGQFCELHARSSWNCAHFAAEQMKIVPKIDYFATSLAEPASLR